jgi:hypothetical protein
VHPPPSPARANFTLMTECTPENSGGYSVYSVGYTVQIIGTGSYSTDNRHGVKHYRSPARGNTVQIIVTGSNSTDNRHGVIQYR